MITIHLIFNAHIDPVWLWPWQAGLDEALATCRSACDRLDAHPDLIFTRGEAWVYREVKRCDPELFERIHGHVAAGRWEIVGGWWQQPDCNLPSKRGMEQQIALGRAYFEETFGQFPRIAYNVDSFGHAAALPEIMTAAGQDRYVMMRPQEHEMTLPARLFRWRGHENGPEVVTFRIARGYTTRHIDRAHIEACLTHLPPGVTDSMCFVGVGDHGGGPTEEQIAWCQEHENAFDGCRLVFSSPSRFFAAVEKHIPDLPLVTGELQQHAVGCYSVYRPIKTAVRRAEHLLEMAENVVAPGSPEAARLKEGWERVCFAHFHDTLGGTCLPSAYPQVLDQVGYAAAVADETLQRDLRRRLRALPDDEHQRIVAFNASGADFSGYVEFEPWLEWQKWDPSWQLTDEQDTPIPYQLLHSEAMSNGLTRVLFRAEIPAGEIRSFRIHRDAVAASPDPSKEEGATVAAKESRTFLNNEPLLMSIGAHFLQPTLHLLPDVSDTWSHRLIQYSEYPSDTVQWSGVVIGDSRPLMASRIQTGRIGQNTVRAEWCTYAASEFVECHMTVHWNANQHVLKLVLPLALPGASETRQDGTMGGFTVRANDGREMPLREWTCLPAATDRKKHTLGIVCPEVFALDSTPHRVRLTLLRSAWMAHHDPYPAGFSPRGVVSDQGVHTFRFRFFRGPDVTPELLEAHARMMQRPPLMADLTRGMPTGLTKGVGG
jgi:alpha-mannosidase